MLSKTFVRNHQHSYGVKVICSFSLFISPFSQLNQENLLVYLFLRGLVLTSLVLLRLSSSLLRLTPISLMQLNYKDLLSEKIKFVTRMNSRDNYSLLVKTIPKQAVPSIGLMYFMFNCFNKSVNSLTLLLSVVISKSESTSPHNTM